MIAQLVSFEQALLQAPAVVTRILCDLPPLEADRERIIRCSRENVDIAIARAVARAVVNGEFWRVEIVR